MRFFESAVPGFIGFTHDRSRQSFIFVLTKLFLRHLQSSVSVDLMLRRPNLRHRRPASTSAMTLA